LIPARISRAGGIGTYPSGSAQRSNSTPRYPGQAGQTVQASREDTGQGQVLLRHWRYRITTTSSLKVIRANGCRWASRTGQRPA
jgi:hypothetical protein